MAPLAHSRSAVRRNCKLFLFCSHPIVERRLVQLLRHTGFEIVCRRELSSPEPMAVIAGDASKSVMVVDGEDIRATLEFLSRLRIAQNQPLVLVLLPRIEDEIAYAFLRLGVRGLVSYDRASRELGRAVGQLSRGAYWMPPELLSRFVESVLPELRGSKTLVAETGLSRREREVLDLLLENLSNKEIAGKLFVTERTVKFHVSNLLGKFGVERRADLIMQWMQRSRGVPSPARDLGRSLSAHIN